MAQTSLVTLVLKNMCFEKISCHIKLTVVYSLTSNQQKSQNFRKWNKENFNFAPIPKIYFVWKIFIWKKWPDSSYCCYSKSIRVWKFVKVAQIRLKLCQNFGIYSTRIKFRANLKFSVQWQPENSQTSGQIASNSWHYT